MCNSQDGRLVNGRTFSLCLDGLQRPVRCTHSLPVEYDDDQNMSAVSNVREWSKMQRGTTRSGLEVLRYEDGYTVEALVGV